MKAAILAGGLGTRLRPVTYSVPKPLIPLCDKPLISHIIDSLPSWVSEVVIAVNYMKSEIQQYFSRAPTGRKIILVDEPRPLGTGGALRNLREHLDERFVAFNGDVVFSMDVGDFVRFHESKGGIGSIALWEVSDPSAFGAVSLSPDMRIQRFQEKPPPGEECSSLINAGVYVFEPEILERIGDGTVSLEREVFPRVMDEGLYGYRFGGYWAQRTIMAASAPSMIDVRLEEGAVATDPNCMVRAVCRGCRVGPYVSAQEGVVMEKGSRVSDSILMSGARVGEGAVVRGSILGPGVRVEGGRKVIESLLSSGPASDDGQAPSA